MIIQNWSFTIFRILSSSIFIVSGFGHLLNPKKLVTKLTLSPGWDLLSSFFNPTYLIVITGIILLTAGLSLLFGLKVRIAACILILILIPITLTVQVGRVDTLGPLFKNIAILGSLILLASNDSGNTSKSQLQEESK